MVWAITNSQTVFSTSQTNPPPQPQALALANGSYIILWGSIYGGHYATTAGWYREPGELIATNANLPGVFYIDGNVGPDLQNGYGSDVIAVALAPNGDLDQLNGQSTFYQGNVWTQVAAFAAGRSYTGAAIARAEINTLSGTGFSDVVTYYDASASGVALEFYNAYANATYTLAATGAVASGATHAVQMFGAADTDLAVSWLSSTGPEISLVDVNGTVLHTDDLPAGIVGDVALASTAKSMWPKRSSRAYSPARNRSIALRIPSFRRRATTTSRPRSQRSPTAISSLSGAIRRATSSTRR